MAGFARRQLDVLGFARSGGEAAVQLFAIRDGKTVNRDVFLLENLGDGPDDEALSAFVKQYYATAGSIPPRVLVPFLPADHDDLEAFLAARRGQQRGASTCAQRGEGRQLSVARRAERRRDARPRAGDAGWPTRARRSARWRSWPTRSASSGPPMRIECYDISTIQGTSTVGSMVVVEEGRPRTGEYRRFRIKTVAGQNDFASHQEVLRRRFRRALDGEEGSAEELRWRLPGPGHHRRRQGPGERRARGARRAGPVRPADGRPGQGARGAVPARPLRPHRAARDLARAVPAPAAARRGPPVRHHVPPQGARGGRHEVHPRRSAGRRAGAQAGAAAGLRDREGRPATRPWTRSRRCRASRGRWRRRSGPIWTADRALRPRLDAGLARVRTPTLLSSRRCVASFLPSSSWSSLVAAAIVVWPSIETKLGLDLIGGLRGEYQLVATDNQAITPDVLKQTRTIIETRVNSTGVAEPNVQTAGGDRISVELPGAANEERDPEPHRHHRSPGLRARAHRSSTSSVVDGPAVARGHGPDAHLQGDEIACRRGRRHGRARSAGGRA